jgi:hypothetical protein
MHFSAHSAPRSANSASNAGPRPDAGGPDATLVLLALPGVENPSVLNKVEVVGDARATHHDTEKPSAAVSILPRYVLRVGRFNHPPDGLFGRILCDSGLRWRLHDH